MALIAAIFGSLAGVVAGIVGTLFFGASVLVGFAIYVTVSLGMIVAFSLSMLFRAKDHSMAAAAAHESQMDADWAQFSQEQGRPMTDEERAFQDGLETPLSDGDRRHKRDRRSSDRRNSA